MKRAEVYVKGKGRGAGGSRVHREYISITNDDSFKLNRLATSTGLKPATLAAYCVYYCLNNSDFVHEIQNQLTKYKAYKIIPIKDFRTEELEYVLEETNQREDF